LQSNIFFRHKNVSPQNLYSEYRCYLNYARIKITECAMETKHWTYLYDGEYPPHTIGKNRFINVFYSSWRLLIQLVTLIC